MRIPILTEKVTVRLTTPERAELEQEAKRRGIRLSALLRERITGRA